MTVNFHGDKTNVLIKELQAYDKNSRTHSDAQINQIVNSIKEFGFTNPVLINDKKEIIAGHGRVEAAKNLGLDSVPCVVLTGLTDAQKRAYIIADNKLALNADWDYDLLKDELDALKTDDFDLELLGFSFDELFLIENKQDSNDDSFGNDGSTESNSAAFSKIEFVLSEANKNFIIQKLNNEKKSKNLETLSDALVSIFFREI